MAKTMRSRPVAPRGLAPMGQHTQPKPAVQIRNRGLNVLTGVIAGAVTGAGWGIYVTTLDSTNFGMIAILALVGVFPGAILGGVMGAVSKRVSNLAARLLIAVGLTGLLGLAIGLLPTIGHPALMAGTCAVTGAVYELIVDTLQQ